MITNILRSILGKPQEPEDDSPTDQTPSNTSPYGSFESMYQMDPYGSPPPWSRNGIPTRQPEQKVEPKKRTGLFSGLFNRFSPLAKAQPAKKSPTAYPYQRAPHPSYRQGFARQPQQLYDEWGNPVYIRQGVQRNQIQYPHNQRLPHPMRNVNQAPRHPQHPPDRWY